MSPHAERLGALLDPRMIEVYLMAHDWEATTRNESFSVWNLPGSSEHLFVPLLTGPADYEQRLQDVVKRLSALERREPDVVATNLRYAAADLIRVGLASPRVGPGEVPIEDGRKLFEGAREMMWAAACATVQARASFGPKAPGAARDYLDGVRLGQTEPGSYVITIISEVAPPAQQALIRDDAAHIDVPFERRVTTRLMKALAATHAAAERVLLKDAPIDTAFEEAVEDGVSANLCAAITKMSEEQAAAELRVSMDWAASRRPTIDPKPVTFEPSALPVLTEAVGALRRLGPFEDETVEGFVVRLNRGKDEAAIGSIVIEGLARGEMRNVHVELPDEQYHLAIKAHDERYPVRVRGTLGKRGRNWVLSDPGQLRLEGDEPEPGEPAA